MKRKKRSKILKAYGIGPVFYDPNTKKSHIIGFEVTELIIIDKIISGKFRGLSPA